MSGAKIIKSMMFAMKYINESGILPPDVHLQLNVSITHGNATIGVQVARELALVCF